MSASLIQISGQGPMGPQGPKGDDGESPPVVWGGITGDLALQTDLNSVLDGKAAADHDHDLVYAEIAHDHDHNNTKNIQGGIAAEYYHLTSSEYSRLNDVFLNYNFSGDLSLSVGEMRIYPPRNLTLQTWEIWTSTAPTGSGVVAQIMKNGVLAETITLSSGQNYVSGVATSSILTTDYLTVNITQVGSTVAGSNMSIRLKGI